MAVQDNGPPEDSEPRPSENEDLLPVSYDKLVTTEKLVHGKHNPRNVNPTDTLRRSIANHGIQHPLVVHSPPEADVYHITDGWQRYQAATDAGWERLPVRVYSTALDALGAAERESMGQEWTTYDWARYCQSIAEEVQGDSTQEVVEQVAARTDHARSPRRIRTYLEVLSLPSEIHTLLTDGPDGSPADWNALRNFTADIRRYNGLSWRVAEHLARRQEQVSELRTIGIAAVAVTFDEPELAQEFINRATTHPEVPLQTIRQQVLFNGEVDRYLEVPATAVRLSPDQKQAVMRHFHQTNTSLSTVVENHIKSLAEEVTE